MSRLSRWLSAFILGCPALALVGSFVVGGLVSAPAPAVIGPPQRDLPIETVAFESGSGHRLSGWFIPGKPRMGSVLLMHGIRANRLGMLGRARWLHRHGFSVLLFDFQGHGESPGRSITFGYLESLDARAAFEYLRRRTPGERVGIIGLSMGGVAALLGDAPLAADAMVLEAVYASFDHAVENRLRIRLGVLGNFLGPLLTWQVKPRLGFDPDVLRPAACIGQLHAPVLLIAGAADQHATLREMRLLYERANHPKELWIIAGAKHVDFHHYVTADYERRVIAFLASWLRSST